jgi:O-antigen ligase
MTTFLPYRTSRAARVFVEFMPSGLGAIWGSLIAIIPFFDFYFRSNYEGVGLYQATLDTHTNVAVSVLATLSLLAAAGFSTFAILTIGVDYRRQRRFFILTLVMVVFATLSSITAEAPTMPLVLATLIIALGMAINFGAINSWEAVFKAFSATAALMFTAAELLAVFSHDYTWGRLGGHAGPNYWGMAAASALMLCLAVRPVPLRVLVVVVALVTLFLAQARGSEIAAVSGAAAMVSVKLVRTPLRRSLPWSIAGVVLIVVIAAFFSEQIAKKILLVDDAYRGAASNGSGRFIGWGETLNIIGAHPMFGVGLRQHEKFLHAVANAHNAYLAVTAEQGFIGLILYVTLTIGALARAAREYIQKPSTSRVILMGFMAFFISLGTVEQVSLATGNSLTLIMFVVAALAWRADIDPERSVAIVPVA